MGDIERRLTKLEHPRGDVTKLAVAHFHFLRDCRGLLARLDPAYAPPDDDALRREAARLAATGKTVAQVAMEGLVRVWDEDTEAHR
jgi:hypothetical protein